MAFPQVPTRNTGSANAGLIVVVLPSGSADTDLIFIQLRASTTSTTWSQTSGTTGWTELSDANGQATIFKQIGAGEANPSFDLSTSERSGFIALRITGHADPGTDQAPERSVVSTGTSTAPNPSSISPTGGAKDYLFIACASYGDGRATWTLAPSGYSNLVTVTTGGAAAGVSLATAELESNTATENPGTFTNTRNDLWSALTVAIHPPSVALPVGRGLVNSPLLGGKIRRLVG